jgi:CHAD domain-containing protein
MLNQEEKGLLQSYIDRSQPGMAYRKRVQIVLLADGGSSAESIAAELNVPVGRVRQFLRVFNRERLKLFPSSMFSPPQPFSPDDPLAEAGRRVMATLVEKAQSHEPDLRLETDVFSVHETRKTCRRLRTAFRFFEPYYEPGVLKVYGKRFGKFMRRLGRSRDIAVFQINFERFQNEVQNAAVLGDRERQSMAAFIQYWIEAQDRADENVRDYMAKGKYQRLIQDFDEFAHSAGMGAISGTEPAIPLRTRYTAPIILYQKAAAVRAYEGFIEGASLAELHALRIQCKELRYSIEFFLPVLGPTAGATLIPLKRILTHLGDLNDARIALDLMAKVDDQALSPFLELYRQKKTDDLEALVSDFSVPWSQLSLPEWRLAFAEAIAVL